MPATAVLVLNDDGNWSLAKFLGRHRDRGPAAGGAASTPGMKYQRVMPAHRCRGVSAGNASSNDEVVILPLLRGGECRKDMSTGAQRREEPS